MIKPYVKYLLIIVIVWQACPGLAQGNHRLSSPLMKEVSGLASSPDKNDIFYATNDSGDTSRFFAINSKGQLKSILYFGADSSGRSFNVLDCEAMATGAGPVRNKRYIYLGDIGDNAAARPYISIYRIGEPARLDSSMHLTAEAAILKYPDGARDAEAMLVDPLSGLLYILSKREDTASIYAIPLTFRNNDTLTLVKKGSFFIAGQKPFKYITDAAISADGKNILIKTYEKVYYRARKNNEPIETTLSRAGVELPYIREWQGESIAFASDGKTYYTVGEGLNPFIYKYVIPGADKKKSK